MTHDLHVLMRQATRLTHAGNLHKATALIRESLRPVTRTGHAAPNREPHHGRRQGAPDPAVVSEQDGQGTSSKREDAEFRTHSELLDTRIERSSFSSHGIRLEYRLASPQNGARPAPLILMLHGCTQDADDFATGTDMDRLATQAGFHVLYPSQSSRRNSRKCWNWFEPAHQERNAGEVAALNALTCLVASRPEIAAEHVFVAGMSAGGAMALVLSEQYPELLAGVGVHSGLPFGIAKSVPQALSAMQGTRRPHGSVAASSSDAPLIVFHGGADQTVHPDNAMHIVASRLKNVEASKVSHDGTRAGRRFVRTVYLDRHEQIVCEDWNLPDAGHRWSGGNPAGSHTDRAGPSASVEMVRFFLKVIRRSAT